MPPETTIVRRLDVPGTSGNWPLILSGTPGAEELCIEDPALAQRLAFAEPRMIRKIIKRYEKSGDLPKIPQRSTVSRYESRPGVWQERSVSVYVLNEEQACFVIAKSETPAANIILREIIHVFTLARRGMLPNQIDLSPITQAITVLSGQFNTTMTTVTARLNDIEARQAKTEAQIQSYVLDAEPMATNPRLAEHDMCKRAVQDLVSQLAATSGMTKAKAFGTFRRFAHISGYNSLKASAYPTIKRWFEQEIAWWAQQKASPTTPMFEQLAEREPAEPPTNVRPIRKAKKS